MAPQTWDPARYEKNARFVSDLGQGVLDLLAAKPGERVLDLGCGDGCVDTIRAALVRALERRGIDGEARVPWYFPTPAEYASRLEAGGFRVDSIVLFPRPTPLPGDILGWLETFAESFTSALAPGARQDYLREVQADLEPKLRDASGTWVADYVRLRFAATAVARGADA